MALLDRENTRYPFAKLTGVEFRLLTTKDIYGLSVFGMSKQSELMDHRLGLPNASGECPTCGESDPFKATTGSTYKVQKEKDFVQCEGHFGHIEFPRGIYHPGYVSQVVETLDSLCLKCLSLKKEKGKRRGLNPRSSCRYCKQGSHPNVNFKIERAKLDRKVIERIYVEADENDDVLPEDYMNILGRRFKDFESGRQYLHPVEALNILDKIPEHVLRQLGMGTSAKQHGAVILRRLLVPPNCNRIPMSPAFELKTTGLDAATKQLKDILKMCSISSSAVTVMEKRISDDGLQASMADYFRVKGAPKVRGSMEPTTDFRKMIKAKSANSYSERFKKQCMKYSSFTSRAVITGDPFLSLDEIGVPLKIADGMTIPAVMTCHNLSDYKLGARPMFVTRGGSKIYMTENATYSIQTGDTVERNIQDGDYVFCTRAPAYHKHAFVGLRACLINSQALAINPALCSPLGADFDGDCLHVFFPQSLHSKAEVVELMMPQKQMLVSHGGQCTFQLPQDTLLGAYQLMNLGVLFDKRTLQQNSMWRNTVPPKPAILKSPQGAFWTANQLLELALPQGLDYEDHDVLIRSSDIITTGGNSDWLKNPQSGILHVIIKRFGGEVAMEFLTVLQNIVSAWLLQRGFSLGLKDVYAVSWQPNMKAEMEHDLRTDMHKMDSTVRERVSLLRSLLSGNKEPKHRYDASSKRDPSQNPGIYDSSLQQLAIEHMQSLLSNIEGTALKHVHTPNSFLSMMRAGSKGSVKKFVEHFAFVGLQLHREKGKLHAEKASLVKSSFIVGLNPHEFFDHTVVYRGNLIHQREQVTNAGSLFKKLMLFMRDVQVEYDGTVRTQYGKHIIQFQYGHNIGIADLNDSSKDLAGEPVGMLAATAIAQAVYEMKSDSPILLSTSLRFLEEILYSRKSSNQRVLLFIPHAYRSLNHMMEKIALEIKQSLEVVTLGMLISSVSIIYASIDDEADWPEFPATMSSDWIIHMYFKKMLVTLGWKLLWRS